MVRIIPCHRTLTTEGFVKLFFREIFPHYGMPQQIVSDRGTQWCNDFFKALCEHAKISLNLSTSYHPQTNGLVERTNEVIGAALRHYVDADHRNWDEQLPFIEFALNNAYHQSTQSTAFRMNRVTLPLNPFEAVVSNGPALIPETTTWLGISREEAGKRTLLQAQHQFMWARKCVQVAKDRMKLAYDKKGVHLHLYEVGHYLWLSMRNISLRHPQMRHKMVPKYVGPLEILETFGRNTVRLDLPESLKLMHDVVHVSLVKPYFPRAGATMKPVQINGLDEWIVQDVVNHNIIRSKKDKKVRCEFQILWKGNAEKSWQEISDLEGCVETLEKYLNKVHKAQRYQLLKGFSPDQLRWLNKDNQKLAKSKDPTTE